MNNINYKRIPLHIGIIPDGNRRWAQSNNKEKHEGYGFGVEPGIKLYDTCLSLGVKELTFYGFTTDNTKRPSSQTKAFQKACVDAVFSLINKDANILVVGNSDSPVFPKELLPYANNRVNFGKGIINVNFLINYGWNWDLNHCLTDKTRGKKTSEIINSLASSEISRIDLIIRWGGRRRLSGFLPVQSVYSDFYIINDYWPNFKTDHIYDALKWYNTQDITLGG